MIHSFDKYVGIEFLENLHSLAIEVINNFEFNSENLIKSSPHLLPTSESQFKPAFEILNADFLTYEWSGSSFIFANSTCFSQELMQSLSSKSEECTKGTFIVTFTKRLPDLSENWKVCDGFKRLMSWGIATVYIHLKIN